MSEEDPLLGLGVSDSLFLSLLGAFSGLQRGQIDTARSPEHEALQVYRPRPTDIYSYH
jgi:hypothetical protein